MAIKTVSWSVDACAAACVPVCPSEVIICVPSSILANPPSGETGPLSVTAIQTYTKDCRTYFLFEYDTNDLATNITLVGDYIKGILCNSCLIAYVDSLVADEQTGWLLEGNSGTVLGTNYAGTSDNVGYDIRVNNARARRTLPNADSPIIIDGFAGNVATGPGDTVGGGGTLGALNGASGDQGYNTVAGGSGNFIALSGFDTIGGGNNNQIDTGHGNTISGGLSNQLDETSRGVIGGGEGNTIILGAYNAIGGGNSNRMELLSSSTANVIAGGNENEVNHSSSSAIVGGLSNEIENTSITPPTISNSAHNIIGGGRDNVINPNDQTLVHNSLYNGLFSGQLNSIIGQEWSFIGGGWTNKIYNTVAFDPEAPLLRGNVISGGLGNTINNARGSAIAGGMSLLVGNHTFGFQSGVNIDIPWAPSQVDVSLFPSIAYFGDTDLWLGNTDNTARKLKFFCPNTDFDYSSAQYTSIEAQAQTVGQNPRWILPATLPAVIGDVLAVDNLSGDDVTLEWLTPTNTSALLGRLSGANFNSTADQPILLNVLANYVLTAIIVGNASVNLTTAVGGFYAGAGKTITLVANTQAYSSLVVPSDALQIGEFTNTANLTAEFTSKIRTEFTLYLSLTTPQGSAATADVWVYGKRLG